MAFGSLVPGMSPMQAPAMPMGGGLGQQGMGILMAALKQQQQQPAAPPAQGASAGPGMPMELTPQGSSLPPMLGGRLMNRLQNGPVAGMLSQMFPTPAPAAMPNMGGAGPAANALTGIW